MDNLFKNQSKYYLKTGRIFATATEGLRTLRELIFPATLRNRCPRLWSGWSLIGVKLSAPLAQPTRKRLKQLKKLGALPFVPICQQRTTTTSLQSHSGDLNISASVSRYAVTGEIYLFRVTVSCRKTEPEPAFGGKLAQPYPPFFEIFHRRRPGKELYGAKAGGSCKIGWGNDARH